MDLPPVLVTILSITSLCEISVSVSDQRKGVSEKLLASLQENLRIISSEEATGTIIGFSAAEKALAITSTLVERCGPTTATISGREAKSEAKAERFSVSSSYHSNSKVIPWSHAVCACLKLSRNHSAVRS